MPRAADLFKQIGRGLAKIYHALSGPGRGVEKFFGPDPIKNAEGESFPPGFLSKSGWWGNWGNWFTSKKVVILTGVSFFLTYVSLTGTLTFLSFLGPVVLPLFLLSLAFCLPMPPAVRRALATLVGFAATVLSVTVMALMLPIHGFKQMSFNPITAIKAALNFWTQTVPGFFTQGGGASAITSLTGAGSAVGKFFMGSAGKVGAFKFSGLGLGAMGPIAGLVLASVAAAGLLSLLVYGGYKLFRGIRNFFKTISAEEAKNIETTEKNFREAKKDLNLKLDVLEKQLDSQKKTLKSTPKNDVQRLTNRVEQTQDDIKKIRGLLKEANKSNLTTDDKEAFTTTYNSHTYICGLPTRCAPEFSENYNRIPELRSRIRAERSSLKAELETIQYLRKHTDNVEQRAVYKREEKELKKQLAGLDKAEDTLNSQLVQIRKNKKPLSKDEAKSQNDTIISHFTERLARNGGPKIDVSDLLHVPVSGVSNAGARHRHDSQSSAAGRGGVPLGPSGAGSRLGAHPPRVPPSGSVREQPAAGVGAGLNPREPQGSESPTPRHEL